MASAAPAYARTDRTERLVHDHMRLVRKLAWHIHGRIARAVEVDDLTQTGMVALVEAARRYEDRGFSFATYASVRVRGAMLDAMRAQRPGGRGAAVHVGPLDQPEVENIADTAPLADEVFDTGGRAADMTVAMAQLPPREAQILSLYFVEGLGLDDIGARLGIGAARVCQIKKAGVARLRAVLA
ncbi:sigma-70 family RNA polymerase sigma factor [Sphingomonas sp. SUN039]|uniref:sigma-70 family RNA polymerase sigma factor n=1 Tax=Sphingomonas sp. SUN039 TaxID=2937787 RepID=UPI002164B65B|nr:sigma-70 family RNA polymerase sigma factor [Sphingomonas sp. SUN039]UVO52898.1 sigma-70 family RNA polymerase sigma factor [Sphingomonas sp. SUN039]